MIGDLFVQVQTMEHSFFRPVSAKAHTFWQDKGFNKYVIDNNEDYYIVKSVDSQKICDEIRKII